MSEEILKAVLEFTQYAHRRYNHDTRKYSAISSNANQTRKHWKQLRFSFTDQESTIFERNLSVEDKGSKKRKTSNQFNASGIGTSHDSNGTRGYNWYYNANMAEGEL